jgi:hypothetical protein
VSLPKEKPESDGGTVSTVNVALPVLGGTPSLDAVIAMVWVPSASAGVVHDVPVTFAATEPSSAIEYVMSSPSTAFHEIGTELEFVSFGTTMSGERKTICGTKVTRSIALYVAYAPEPPYWTYISEEFCGQLSWTIMYSVDVLPGV